MDRKWIEELNEQVAQEKDKVIEYRRHIHQNPELGNQEFETAAYVLEHLKKLNIDKIYSGLAGGTGILAIIEGDCPGPVVGLRCDMDALPVKEKTGLSFASEKTALWGDQGIVPVMHACGHDVHTAILMCVAEILSKMKGRLKGKVLLIFQPAEEGCASDWKGHSGALRFIEEPVYQKNLPDAVFGLHNNPYADNNTAGVCGVTPGVVGYYMDILRITVTGESCHGSTPWAGRDTVIAAADILMNIQTLVTKTANINNDHVSVTMGAIHGGSKFNVIADKTVIDGAIRFTNIEERERLEKRFCEIVEYTAKAHECEATVEYTWIPANYNDPRLYEQLLPDLDEVMGDKYSDKGFGFTALDDFSWYTEKSRGLFFGLSSSADGKEDAGKLHEATFKPNEKGFIEGVRLLSACALSYTSSTE